ncbi:AraC family transcriptional regulator [Subtercola vilae]|uniref:AraC family transcriptional regulator n=1 Tax=Subtercola vilae TaxID=2056433 RepID=A0A4T2C0G0_9MICO|nr:AraC family transcriptional regulator [Subtercola vilae]TIH35656.1 AraC family transcriptional regulator [Subtercola vilae]
MGFTETSAWSWQGVDGLRSGPNNIVPENAQTYRSEGRRWNFADVAVSDVAQTPARVTPSSDEPEQHDYISVVFVRNGRYDLFDRGERLHFDSGEVGFMRGWNAVTGENPVLSRVAMVTLHRERLANQGVQVQGQLGGFRIGARLRGPSLSFVLALMHEVNAPVTACTETAESPTSTVLTQLMAGLFLEDAGYRMDSALLTSGLKARADALIARQASDPLFTPQQLANQLNVSLRHLQRSFSASGVGPAEAIRLRRLEIALRALTSASPHSVGTIALQSGFSSVKELRFALRANYGVTPREVVPGILPQPK